MPEAENGMKNPWWMEQKVNVLPLFINSGMPPGGTGRPPAQGEETYDEARLGTGFGCRLDDSELDEFINEAMGRLRPGLTEANLLQPVVITEKESEIFELRDSLRGDVDIIMPLTAGPIYTNGWRHSTPIEARLDIVGKPVLRFAYIVWDFLGLDVVAALKAQGVEAYFAASLERANKILKTMRIKKALAQTKIMVHGTLLHRGEMLADGVPSNLVDPALIRAKTGVELQYIYDEDLKKAVESVSVEEGGTLGAKWAADATEIKDIFREGETDSKWFTYQARLYLGMKRLMEKHGCTAWSGCHDTGHMWDPEFTAPPCFSFVRLKDEGYPCGCEADQGALLAMIMLMYLAEAPADMGNCVIPTYTDNHMEDWQMPTPGPNIVIISHSVTPLKMDGFDKPDALYSICGTHCSTCNAINNYVELREGQPVTIARLGPGAKYVFIAEGTIDSTHMTPVEGNRNAAYIRVKDRDDFYEKQSLVGNHLTFVYGSVGDELADLCRELGIEPVIA